MRKLHATISIGVALALGSAIPARAASDYERATEEQAAQNRAVARENDARVRQRERDEALSDFDRREELFKAYTRALDGHDVEAMRRARDALLEEEARQARNALLKEQYSR